MMTLEAGKPYIHVCTKRVGRNCKKRLFSEMVLYVCSERDWEVFKRSDGGELMVHKSDLQDKIFDHWI